MKMMKLALFEQNLEDGGLKTKKSKDMK